MIFDEILNSIENEDIKQFAEKCVNELAPYFYVVPASSTGKYHPSYSLGEGGLLRHSIAVVRFLNHMFNVESIANQFTSRERDLLRVAAMMHDSRKSGGQEEYEKSKWTKFNHPLLAAELIRSLDGLPREEIELVAHAIESHMGIWNTDKRYPNLVLPKPQDKYQIILHLADYLASRKDIELLFDDEIPVSEPEPLPDINTWKFDFGKYAGKTIPEVKAENPGYIHWAKENMRKEPARTLLQQI